MNKSRTSSKKSRSARCQPAGHGSARGRGARAFPIVVSGPSGVGKTTVVGEVLKKVPELRRSVSVTTRPSRADEVEGESYFFVDKRRFRRLQENELVEWAEVHGHLYGTPRRFIESTLDAGFDVILNIDVQGARQVKKSFPDAVMIFILPPSFEVLEQRIRHRSADLTQDIETRLDNARGELRAMPEYEFIIVNDKLRDAVAALEAIVASERCRRERYSKSFLERFK